MPKGVNNEGMKPRRAAALALVGCYLLIPSVGKTQEIAQSESQSEAAQEMQDAEAVRQRHLPDLMKIPHVVGMGIGLSGLEIAFDLEVDQEANVPQVERLAPPKIEGYDVEVVEAPRGVGY
jgi:hypothetical protein